MDQSILRQRLFGRFTWLALGWLVGAPAIAGADDLDLPAESLTGVRDLTGGFDGPEREAYYQTLRAARDADRLRLRAAGLLTVKQAEERFRSDPANARRRFSLFYDIVKHPEAYRGKPVTLQGYLQRLATMPAGENDQNLTELQEAYLFTADSLQSPYVIVAADVAGEIPIPRKGSPTNDVEVSGYFFKLWAYDAERGRWAAPLILAPRIDWHPRPASWVSGSAFRWALAASMIALFLGLAGLTYRQRRKDRLFRQQRDALAAAEAARNLAAFQPHDPP